MSLSSRSHKPFVGRGEETRLVEELTGAAREGRGGVLVLRGEAGIGKSALLDRAEVAAPGFRVLRASGSWFESELPFASLHQLCRPLYVPAPGRLAELPAQHREVLEVAFGLAAGRPDVFRAGLAALELLAVAAREQPLLCVVDDAQWADAASSKALAFIARRIAVEPIAMVFATRPSSTARELDELPGLDIGGLGDGDARALLAAKSRGTLDEQVRDRILAEARGNPLALLQLPGADGFALPDTSSAPNPVERGFQARLAELPPEARLLLTVASADPTGDPNLLWPAAQRMDIDVTATSAAVTASGLAEFGTRVRFCHPLARSAVYLAAGDAQRRTAHDVLAEVTDPALAPDRQAWHRARAGTGPDDGVAAQLERAATCARARGGAVAAAAFIHRAAELSLAPGKRTERTLAAAAAHLDAGAADTASSLLATVENATLDEHQHARADLLRGRIAFVRHEDADGTMFMVRAGQRLEVLDPVRSREYFLDALEMSLTVGRAGGVRNTVLASAAASAAPGPRPPDILDALTLLSTHGHRVAVPLIRDVLTDTESPLWIRRPALAVMLTVDLWDARLFETVTRWLMKTGRESGSPLVLRLGLAQAACHGAFTGDLGRAMEAITEEEAIADATGVPPVTYHRLHLAAMRGRREEAADLFEAAAAQTSADGTGQLAANVDWAEAVLYNSLADYPAALTAARRAVAHDELGHPGLALPELIEAAVRCDEPAEAAAALEPLTERTRAAATPTGLGIAAYARGLVTGAEDHYREAIGHLDDSPLLPYRARAHLLYGEWLRRQGRKKDSRHQLRTAHRLLSRAGLEAFAHRAAEELRAAGEKPGGDPSGHGFDQLTLQEVHIARLVATGATSNEVAARLFLSPRTVESHLRNIFRKLGITSRRQLKDVPRLHADRTP